MDVSDIFWKLTRGVRFDRKFQQGHGTRSGLSDIAARSAVRSPPWSETLTQTVKKRKLSESRLSGEDDPDDSIAQTSAKTGSKLTAGGHQATDSTEKQDSAGLRKLNRIHVQGTDVPMPVASFDELKVRYGVSDQILANLRSMGYFEPTPVQMQAVPVMLERREVLGCAPTGSGKTAAYLLPVLHRLREPRSSGCRALVVAPSRELARQIALETARLSHGTGLRVRCLDRVKQRADQPRAVSSRYDILVTTPNRLLYLLDSQPPLVSLSTVQWLVVDESDKLFEAGVRGFRDQLGRIYSACDTAQVRRALFSATFAYDVDQWCKVNLDNVVTVSVGQKNTTSDVVEQELVFTGSEGGKLYAFRNILQTGLDTPCLIFVQTKERAKELFRELIYAGIMVDVIHADRTQAQRDNVVKAFRSGGIWVLICTELMGRGIDFKGVNLVINYDVPSSTTSYIHRIGRTGRAGRPGRAITFFTLQDVPNMRQIAHLVKNSGCDVPDYLLQAPKKSKTQRRRLALHPVQRETIDTTSAYDKEHIARIKALKKAQDRREAESRDGAKPPPKKRKKKKKGVVQKSAGQPNMSVSTKKSKAVPAGKSKAATVGKKIKAKRSRKKRGSTKSES